MLLSTKYQIVKRARKVRSQKSVSTKQTSTKSTAAEPSERRLSIRHGLIKTQASLPRIHGLFQGQNKIRVRYMDFPSRHTTKDDDLGISHHYVLLSFGFFFFLSFSSFFLPFWCDCCSFVVEMDDLKRGECLSHTYHSTSNVHVASKYHCNS